MAKRIEITVPTTEGTSTETGQVAWLWVGKTRVKFFLQDRRFTDNKILTHYASGYKFSDLQPIAVDMYARTGKHTAPRDLAAIAIEQAVRKHGAEHIISTMAGKPVLNP